MLPLFPSGRLTVVGHRGLSAHPTLWGGAVHSANTVAGVLAAYDCGARWVELDVHVTSDLCLALVHDEVLPGGVATGLVDSRSGQPGLELLSDLLLLLPEEMGVVVDVKPSLSDLPGRRARSTAELVVDAIEADRVRAPHRQFLVYGDVHSLPFTLARLRAERSVPFGIGVYGEADTSLVGVTSTAIDAGADVVSLHTSSYLGQWAGPPYCAAPVAETIEAGRSHGLQYMAWVAAVGEVPALAGLGVDAVCMDDLPYALPALSALRFPAALPHQTPSASSATIQ